MIDDRISIISPSEGKSSSSSKAGSRSNIEYIERLDLIGEMEDSGDWTQRAEADQAHRKPESPKPEEKVTQEPDRKKYTKIAFTDSLPLEDGDDLTEHMTTAEVHGDSDAEEADRPITPQIEANSDTESQGQGYSGIGIPDIPEAITSSPKRNSANLAVPDFEVSVVQPEVQPSSKSATLETENADTCLDSADSVNKNLQEPMTETVDSFSRLFTQEMKDDEIQLPWLDKPGTEKVEKADLTAKRSARHREGFLQRKGDWTGFWRRRYFKLYDHKLTYYRSDTDESAAQVYHISQISDVVEEAS